MPLLIAALLGLSAAIVVLYPLFGLERRGDREPAPATLAEAAERERAAKGALREVEFDHRLGNLEDADYQALRGRYEARALSALKSRYLREQELDALIERQLDALRAEGAATPARASDGHTAAPRPISAPRRQPASNQAIRARRRRGGGV